MLGQSVLFSTPLLPFLSAVASFVIFSWLFLATRDHVNSWIGRSRGRATLFSILSVGLIPIIVGAWSDIIDVSAMLQGNWNQENTIGLSAILFLIGFYCYLHGCGFYSKYKLQEELDHEKRRLEEERDEEKRRFDAEIAAVRQQLKDREEHWNKRCDELECQNKFLLSLQNCFLEVMALREASINSNLSNGVPKLADLLCPSWQLERYVDAVRSSYQSIKSSPYPVRALLLKVSGDPPQRLEPVYSFDGGSRKWFDVASLGNADALDFKNEKYNLAVNAAHSERIWIVEDATAAAADGMHPFNYYGDEYKRMRQKENIKSVAAIPFWNNDKSVKYVLVLDSKDRDFFVEKHSWKAEKVQKELGVRAGILEAFAKCMNGGPGPGSISTNVAGSEQAPPS